MTVKQLIDKLKERPDDAEVLLFNEATGDCDLPLADVREVGDGVGLSPSD